MNIYAGSFALTQLLQQWCSGKVSVTSVQYFLVPPREKNHQSLECHSVAEIYTAATWQVMSKCPFSIQSFQLQTLQTHTFWMSKSINTVILSPQCFREGQLQPCIINKTLKAANIKSVRKGKTEWYREMKGDQQWARERERDWWWRGVNVCAPLIPPRWEVREECFQGLQQHPTCSFLRMHCHERKLGAGRVTAQAHQSTLTSCPCHAVGVFPLDGSLNHL